MLSIISDVLYFPFTSNMFQPICSNVETCRQLLQYTFWEIFHSKYFMVKLYRLPAAIFLCSCIKLINAGILFVHTIVPMIDLMCTFALCWMALLWNAVLWTALLYIAMDCFALVCLALLYNVLFECAFDSSWSLGCRALWCIALYCGVFDPPCIALHCVELQHTVLHWCAVHWLALRWQFPTYQ